MIEKLDNLPMNAEDGKLVLAPKAAKLREHLRDAARVALLDIEENEKSALDAIKREAANKKATVLKKHTEFQTMTDVKLIRKYWHAKTEDIFLHFIGDQTKVGNFGSAAAEA